MSDAATGLPGLEINRRRVFLGCFIALVATAFGFAVRAAILKEWREQFNLSNEQVGYIQGAGLYPFAISIILFSLIVDRIGYGVSMAVAFTLHIVSAVVTLCAPLALAGEGADPETIQAGRQLGYWLLYFGTFLYALGNGTVEAVINPVVATMYERNKTHWLNVLHAGWPGGLVLGGLLAIGIDYIELEALPGSVWQWQMAVVLIPMLVYGGVLVGQKFPVQERVAAGVSYMDMLREFGAGSCLIVCFLLAAGLDQILVVLDTSLQELLHAEALVQQYVGNLPGLARNLIFYLAVAVVPTLVFLAIVRRLGRPMFIFLLLIMFLLATTELGTDSWIADIMRSVLESPTQGTLFLVYTSFIMFVLRFFAGPIVHRISPLGLLAACAAIAAIGLLWLASAGSAVMVLFAAATFYGIGKTFFWPTTLGVVSEQYPRGGALMLNAIAGVGMIAVGTLGNPTIGFVQDQAFNQELKAESPDLHRRMVTEKPGLYGVSYSLSQEEFNQMQERMEELPEDSPKRREIKGHIETIEKVERQTKQQTLAKIAVLPAIMFLCYLSLIFYFRKRGGYQAQVLTRTPTDEEKMSGGLEGPVE